MKVQVYYFNDRKNPVRVGLETLMDLTEVQPATGHIFELDIKKDECIFVKNWEYDMSLISKMKKKVSK